MSLRVKAEVQSARVKGLSFHKRRPWLLASLHNGAVHLYDYERSTLLEKYAGHEGPVRGVHFHPLQGLFVTGGDDGLVKVWDFRKCLFTLTGHMDYVRSVEFHASLAWVASASDDQTVRLWNWQSRVCLAIVTGHLHYVMCARFHPDADLLASVSLDGSLRIWDFSRLREKNLTASGGSGKANPNEFVIGLDVVVREVAEKHSKGVNWVSFSPTGHLLATASDDKSVKVWKLTDHKMWELDSLRGHSHNVTCVLFHPSQDVLLSCAEDKHLLVWDTARRASLLSHKRDTDRLWMFDVHRSYFAAGHDQGFLLFKLERERPPSARVHHDFLLHATGEKTLSLRHLRDPSQVIILAELELPGRAVLLNYPQLLYYNAFSTGAHQALVLPDHRGADAKFALLLQFKSNWAPAAEPIRLPARSAVFLSSNRVCVLDASAPRLHLLAPSGERHSLDWPGLEALEPQGLFPWPKMGRVLLKVPGKVLLLDVAARKVLGELEAGSVKRTAESGDLVCLIGSKRLTFVSVQEFAEVARVEESEKVKSGFFDREQGVFLYSTPAHLKYCLLNPQASSPPKGVATGLLRTVSEVCYLTHREGASLSYLGRDGQPGAVNVSVAELMAKVALRRGDVGAVAELLRTGSVRGLALTDYLRETGHSELALQFEQDPRKKFNLALESGNLGVALSVAKQLKEKSCFQALASKALLLGQLQVAEQCYQLVRDCSKLSFLYGATGAYPKLMKMPQVSQKLGDTGAHFHDALQTGDVAARVQILANAGQLPLALLLAKTHGQTKLAEQIQDLLNQKRDEGVPYSEEVEVDRISQDFSQAKALVPPRPLFLRDAPFEPDWPMRSARPQPAAPKSDANLASQIFGGQAQHAAPQDLTNLLSSVSSSSAATPASTAAAEQAESSEKPPAEWGGDDLDLDIPGGEPGWEGGDGDDLDIPEGGGEEDKQEQGVGSGEIYVPPTHGSDAGEQALVNSEFAGDQCLIGNYKQALTLLKQ